LTACINHSSLPLAITPIVATSWADTNNPVARRSKAEHGFSFHRFLVPHLMVTEGLAIFKMDCDMLCRTDIAALWALRDDRFPTVPSGVQHATSDGTAKFSGEVQRKRLSKKELELADVAQLRPLQNRPHTRLRPVETASGPGSCIASTGLAGDP